MLPVGELLKCQAICGRVHCLVGSSVSVPWSSKHGTTFPTRHRHKKSSKEGSLFERALDETAQIFVDLADVLIVWSEDGTKAFIALDEQSIPAGEYRLSFVYSLDIGPGAPVLRRSGSTLPEVAVLEFSLPA